MKELAKALAKQATQDGYKTIRKVMRDLVPLIERDFMAQAMVCLDEYYNEYTMPPRKYQRTTNLYHNVAQKYKIYRNGEINVGVRFSTDKMDTYKRTSEQPFKSKYFNTLEELVVGSAMEGYHGYAYIAGETDTIDYKMKQFTTEYGVNVLDQYFRNLGFEV